MFQATLGDLSGLEEYLAADGKEARKFDMVDGGAYDGDKACKSVDCSLPRSRERVIVPPPAAAFQIAAGIVSGCCHFVMKLTVA